MNRIILVSVLLVALSASAKARDESSDTDDDLAVKPALDEAQALKCLDEFYARALKIKYHKKIEEVAKFVRSHDKSQSMSVFDILASPDIKVDLEKFTNRQSAYFYKLASKFLDTVLLPAMPPNECKWDQGYSQLQEQVESDESDVYHAAITKVYDYAGLCEAIKQVTRPMPV